MKSTSPPTTDTRPRFGWTDSPLDNDPQVIKENKDNPSSVPVVVIPLPYLSTSLRKQVKLFAKGLWPKEES